MSKEQSVFDSTTKFFLMGWVPAKVQFLSSLRKSSLLEKDIHIVPLKNCGYFYFNHPWYMDFAENDSIVCIKFGQVHDNSRLLSAKDILLSGIVTSTGINFGKICGNGVVICFSKKHPQCYMYRNLLSISSIYYWKGDENFLVTNNLRLMIDILPDPQLNEDILPQHFLFRAVYGGQTYVHGVRELLTGENLTWQYGDIKVDLRKRVGDLYDHDRQMIVNSDTAELFFSKLKEVIAIYMDGKEYKTATMLSGGIDSSLLQVIINELGNDGFPSFSFVIDSKAFEFEVQYVRDAIEKLRTQHTFCPITPTEYRDSLIKSIQVLGQPVPDDVRPCFFALADIISFQHQEYSYWVHGHIADGLTGEPASLEVVQGDKYRDWPIRLLKVLGKLLTPFSQSKSYGASKAAQTLLLAQDLNSPGHHLNSGGLYTDWNMMSKCFDKYEISEAFSAKRELVNSHINSNFFVENMNTLHLLTGGVETASITRQLGIYFGGEYLFPYGDESVLQAVYSFEPFSRYTSSNQVKPILKFALGSRLPVKSLDGLKGWSGVGADLWTWMREGSLLDMVRAIERPGFITPSDFELKLQNPDWFTWNLLTLDIFKKSIQGPPQ